MIHTMHGLHLTIHINEILNHLINQSVILSNHINPHNDLQPLDLIISKLSLFPEPQ